MTHAGDLKRRVDSITDEISEIQRLIMQVKDKIELVQNGVLFLDLEHSNSHFVRSAARMAPTVGSHLGEDQETLMQIQSELRQWRYQL